MKKQRMYSLLCFLLLGFYSYAWDPDEFGPEPPPDDVSIDQPVGALAIVILILFVMSKIKWPKSRLHETVNVERNEQAT